MNEYTTRYDGEKPHKIVGIMEFRYGRVIRKRIYVGEPWEAPAGRSQWVELMTEDS